MVQGKGRRNKPNGKTKGKPVDGSKLNAQLALIGLKITHVVADGNCLFRAIADQLEGNEEEHTKYRHMVVDHIENHREELEPFVEDEIPFDDYCKGMRQNGTWAGHMELQAASLVSRTNICIHRLLSPRWQICNFENQGVHTMHLSYHDGEHYNSVRRIDDDGIGPAKSIILEGDDKSISKSSVKNNRSHSDKVPRKISCSQDSIKLVMAGTGCLDQDKVWQVLQEVHGDTDAAIEFLVVDQNCTDDGKLSNSLEATELIDNVLAGSVGGSVGDQQAVESQKLIYNGETASFVDGNRGIRSLQRACNGLSSSSQKVARNKACPCGSKKKYKACCGAVRQKTTARVLTSSQETLANKSRKEKSRSATGQLQIISSSLDMGSLCI